MEKGVLVFCYCVTNYYQFPLPSFGRKGPVQLQLGPLLRTSQGWQPRWRSLTVLIWRVNQKKICSKLTCTVDKIQFTGLVGWGPCFLAGHQPGLLLESRSCPQIQARWLLLQTLPPGRSLSQTGEHLIVHLLLKVKPTWDHLLFY